MTLSYIITRAHKSKTLIVAHLISIIGFLEMNQHLFSNILTQQQMGYFIFGIGIVMAVLRAITSKPLSEKENLK